MAALPLPAYPSEGCIRYALWLKRFATQLPDYADCYGLSVLQLLEVQSIAGEYLDLLIWHLQQASAGSRQLPARTLANAPELAGELLSCHEYTQLIQYLVSKFVRQVQQHPAYTARAGHALQLDAIPPLS